MTARPGEDVERLFRRLVANIAALDPARLDRAFPIADITTSLVPYRTHRKALGLDTSEDYDFAVLRFLAGEGGYALVEPSDAAEAFVQECLAVNPDPLIVKRFTAAVVRLDPARVHEVLEAEPAPPAAAPAPGPALEAGPSRELVLEPGDAYDDPAPPLPFTLEEEPEEPLRPVAQPRAPMAGGGCQYCGGELPIGRAVLFCPHCGQNVGVVHCPTCDAELDVGWRFCITCGQTVSGGLA